MITDLRVGGAEAMLERLVTAEPRLAETPIVVSLLPGGRHVETLRAAGIRVVELRFDNVLGIPAGLIRLARLIARHRPEVVQGWMYHGDLAALVALLISGRRRRTRLLWGIRCADLDLGRYGRQLGLVVRACARLSGQPDIVTANSVAGLEAHLRLGYRPRRAEVVANGIDTDRFRPDPAARLAVRAELGLPAEGVVLAHVARVDPAKDHEGFLAAMDMLPDLRAMTIGAGTERLPARPNVLGLGQRNDVARLLAAADIVVSSSTTEGFSNAIAEGMACGLPAVATDVGDARIIVDDTGLLVPAGDPAAFAQAVRRLVAEGPAGLADRGARARARVVGCFSIARAQARFAELYVAEPTPGVAGPGR